jgi:hypothetical protein
MAEGENKEVSPAIAARNDRYFSQRFNTSPPDRMNRGPVYGNPKNVASTGHVATGPSQVLVSVAANVLLK